MVEPRECGELGYGDWCIHLFEMGLCFCDGCGGHMVHGTCISCGCRQRAFALATARRRFRAELW